ncbi:MAG: hypothetical protein K2V38_13180, partial [Gemmataceae bacterium]|nr:hypothetical protein [Gemmataceae bacterium]
KPASAVARHEAMDAAVAALVAKGKTRRQIRKALGVGSQSLAASLERTGLVPVKRAVDDDREKARLAAHEKIVRLRGQGKTYAQIAAEVPCSVPLVSKVLTDRGMVGTREQPVRAAAVKGRPKPKT